MRRLPLPLRLMQRRARRGPAARYDVTWDPAVPVPGPAGALLTDHYAPVTTEPCPAVLLRAPYIRAGFPFNWLYGLLVAEQGFHVLMQTTRGTGGSDGEFRAWGHETEDGTATVEWIRKQEWFTGDLFTLGASYTAYTQAALAKDPPPEWRGAIPQLAHFDAHRFFWSGGAFGLERALVGGTGLFGGSRQTLWTNMKAIARLQRHLKRTIREVPLLESYQLLYNGRRPEFERWVTAPDAGDEKWRGADATAAISSVEIPVSLSAGWHDLSTDQVIDVYRRRRAAGLPVDLLIGPWTHTSALEQGFGEVFAQTLRALRGETPAQPVRIHVGGAGEWRDLPDWPPASSPLRLHLGAGTLRSEPGSGSTTFRYDPRKPTPSIGGALQSPTQGTRDNAPLESRPDVVVFTGPALDEAVEVMGEVRAEFDAGTTAASGDLFARLCDVDPAGKSINVCDGLTRFAEDGRVIVEMGSTAHRFRPGHRIRLLVAGGAHPRYLRNYGTGEPPGPATRMVPTDTTVQHSSVVVLPVVV